MVERKFDNFDNYADEYRMMHTSNIKRISGVDSNYFSEYKVLKVKDCEANNSKCKILDVGCGDGNSAKYFIKHLLPDHYYGIDISKASIDVAQKQKLEQCTFLTYDGVRIPFQDESFDIVFIANVLHHINSDCHKKTLNECHRVLKWGGRLYIFEHNTLNPVTRKIVRECQFDEQAVLIPAKYLIRTIIEVGFLSFNLRYTIFFPRWRVFRYLIPLEKYLSWCPFGGQYYVSCKKC